MARSADNSTWYRRCRREPVVRARRTRACGPAGGPEEDGGRQDVSSPGLRFWCKRMFEESRCSSRGELQFSKQRSSPAGATTPELLGEREHDVLVSRRRRKGPSPPCSCQLLENSTRVSGEFVEFEKGYVILPGSDSHIIPGFRPIPPRLKQVIAPSTFGFHPDGCRSPRAVRSTFQFTPDKLPPTAERKLLEIPPPALGAPPPEDSAPPPLRPCLSSAVRRRVWWWCSVVGTTPVCAVWSILASRFVRKSSKNTAQGEGKGVE